MSVTTLMVPTKKICDTFDVDFFYFVFFRGGTFFFCAKRKKVPPSLQKERHVKGKWAEFEFLALGAVLRQRVNV